MKLSIVLYTSKTLNNGEHPIMLRLYHQGKLHYKSLKISCKLSDWNNKESKCRKSFKRHASFNQIIQKEYNLTQTKIDKTRAEKKPFNINYIFQQKEEKRKTLLELIEEQQSTYTRYNTIRKYINVKNRLMEYGLEYTFVDEVDAVFLEKFYYQLKKNRKDISVYTYMATLKSCLSAAIKKNYMTENPFSHTDFKFNKKTTKRALDRSDIAKLVEHYNFHYTLPPNTTEFTPNYNILDINSEYYALNLFLSSYFLQGLSLIDMAKLTVKDVKIKEREIGSNKDISEYQEKSIMLNAAVNRLEKNYPNNAMVNKLKSRKNAMVKPLPTEKTITIELNRNKTNKEVKIVNKYDKLYFVLRDNLTGKSENDYLFNIYNDKCDSNITKRNSRLTYITNVCNKKLEEIRKKLELNIDHLTMYCARHTYASTLYHSGANSNMIAQNLGRDIRNIDVYLKEFDEEKIIEANSVL